MCLVVKKGTEKQILTKDLTVYKIVALDNKNVVSAPYQRFEYEVNTLYKTKIKKTKTDTCKFDYLAGVPYLNLLHSHGMTLRILTQQLGLHYMREVILN